MKQLFERLQDVIASVYLYNEYTGYIELEKLLDVLHTKYPHEETFIQAVQKHCDDERKHYLMFRNYFKKKNRLPFDIGPTYGYVDLFPTCRNFKSVSPIYGFTTPCCCLKFPSYFLTRA